ncbi:MAG: thioesterase family protein [Silicimonas sp.]|nr:thioesterase family protein [Silicimonas sp.]
MEDPKSLTEIIANARPEEGGLRFDMAPNWTQGRTAFGGFTTALMIAGVERLNADLPPLRSAMINFTAPVAAPPRVTSEILRQGRNMTTIAARAQSGGKLAATATFSFGQPQTSRLSHDLPAEAAPAPDTGRALTYEGARFPAPAFFGNFEMIPLNGDTPFSGSDEIRIRVWARHKDPAQHDSLPGLLAIADFLPPVVLPRLSVRAMNSSVNWMVNLLPEIPRTRDGWWLIESRLSAGHNGYSSQIMRVWNTEGALVIDGMQSVVIFEQP